MKPSLSRMLCLVMVFNFCRQLYVYFFASVNYSNRFKCKALKLDCGSLAEGKGILPGQLVKTG